VAHIVALVFVVSIPEHHAVAHDPKALDLKMPLDDHQNYNI